MKAFKKWSRAERKREERRSQSSYEVAYGGITDETVMNLVESDSDGSQSHTLSHKTYVSKGFHQHLDAPAHGRLASWWGRAVVAGEDEGGGGGSGWCWWSPDTNWWW